MRAVLQRVRGAAVSVDGQPVASVGAGLCVLVAVGRDDGPEDARYMADKIVNLRVFEDAGGKFNLSALEVGAEVLVVSQFTLYGDCRKGRRPSFTDAAEPGRARELLNELCGVLRGYGLVVREGVFGARMLVGIENDGPVTLLLDSRKAF